MFALNHATWQGVQPGKSAQTMEPARQFLAIYQTIVVVHTVSMESVAWNQGIATQTSQGREALHISLDNHGV